ncbi:hypothetical protein Hanom_Chr10g00909581 [Helianthus anomalus]
MIENARGNIWAMYPRFIQMLINDQHPKLPHEGDSYKFHVPTGRQLTEIKTNEWVMLHDWMYTTERLPLVKVAYKKYREALKAKQQKDVQAEEEVEEEEEEEDEQLKRKRKGKQAVDEEPSKKKKSTQNPERLMGASFRAADSQEHRQHIQDMRAIHEMEERQKKEKKLARRQMTDSEIPVVVTEEEERLDDFVDNLLVDPDEASASKKPPSKKKKTDEGSSTHPQVKPTRMTQPAAPPQRIRPFSRSVR